MSTRIAITEDMRERTRRMAIEHISAETTWNYRRAMAGVTIDEKLSFMAFAQVMADLIPRETDQRNAIALLAKALWYRGYCAGQSARDEEPGEQQP